MQEINLLQNKVKDRSLSWERRNRLILTFFTLVVILEILAGGGLYVLGRTTNSEVQSVQQSNQAIQNTLNSNQKDLSLAKGLQAQLKNLRVLINNHVYWSTFINTLNSLTTKKAQYSSVSGSSTDKKIHLQGVAASYTDLGKLILSLSTSDSFTDVKLTSVSPSTTQTFGYTFDIELKAAPKLFTKPQ